MLQVHVVTSANRHLYQPQLDEFFRWRYRIYVEDKGWMPANATGREVDQFDHDDAFYLLGYAGDQFVTASRLVPCSRPILLRDVFPHLLDMEPLPRADDWAEWTRMFTVPGARERGHQGVSAAMCCAVMEYCVAERVRWIGGIQEAYWLPRWMDFGWEVKPLGLPQMVDGTSCVAAFMRASPASLSGIRAVTGIQVDQIVNEGPYRPFVPHQPQDHDDTLRLDEDARP